MKRTEPKNFLTQRIVVLLVVFSLVSSALISVINIVHMRHQLILSNRENLKTLVQIAANSLNGDILEQIGPEDMNSEAYCKIFHFLDQFRISENVKYIYTMRKVGDTVQFIVDVDDEDFARVGDEFPMDDTIRQAFAGMLAVDEGISHDVWGDYYSAFAPVYNSSGQVAAIVGIDCSIESIQHKVAMMGHALVVLHLICAGVLGLLSVALSQIMNRYLADASTDSLTGLYNRKYALGLIEQNAAEGQRFGFLILDVDNFKDVNDSCGHQTGDRLLQALAGHLAGSCRRMDIALRLGGDEFALYVDRVTDPPQLEAIAHRLQQAFAQDLQRICPQLPQVGLSFGGVTGSGKVAFTEMYRHADQLLYQVKESGKGGCRIEPLQK